MVAFSQHSIQISPYHNINGSKPIYHQTGGPRFANHDPILLVYGSIFFAKLVKNLFRSQYKNTSEIRGIYSMKNCLKQGPEKVKNVANENKS